MPTLATWHNDSLELVSAQGTVLISPQETKRMDVLVNLLG